MRAEEVAELSRLLDYALALDPNERATWLAELEESQPETARHLRSMLAQTQATDTVLLPRLPELDSGDAVAVAGERVGPYVLVREIGQGGMGSVWLAERADGAFQRKVALKLPRLVWAAGLSRRMARERAIGALLEHVGIARLYDAGVDQHGRPYIAMEYIEGQPIDVYSKQHALDVRARLQLFLQVVHAVAYAHERLVLHRDLKPGNVLVDAAGQAHLLDFGIAKLLDEAAAGTQLTQELGRVLTLNYASPEQIAGRPVGVTADVYSLGVLLFELLTGSLPYATKRKTQGALEDAILAGDAPLASSRATDKRDAKALRGDLDAIVAKAIKRAPAERYQTADALAADIRSYLEGRAVGARPDSAWYRLRKAVVRRRVPVAATTAVLIASLVGAGATLLEKRKSAAEAERTRLATAFVSELFRMNALQEPVRGFDTTSSDNKPAVDRGIELIEVKFQGQPELQAELYGAVARVYLDLGIDRKATDYATRQLASLRTHNADQARIASALMLMAEAFLAADRNTEAEGYARQAVALLPESATQAPDAVALLARALDARYKFEEAARAVKDGERILAAQKRTKSAAGAWLKSVQSNVLAYDNKFDQTTPLVDLAIAEAIEAEGPGSLTAARLRIGSALFLIRSDRPDEGRPYARRAFAALEQAGGVLRVRASLWRASMQLAEYLNSSASFVESMAVMDEVSRFLRSPTSGAPPEAIAEADFHRARAYARRGEYELACPLAETSTAILHQATQRPIQEYRTATELAGCAMYRGDHELADKYARQALALRVKMGLANWAWTSTAWSLVALNLSMAGRHHEAEVFLADAPKFTNDSSAVLARAADVIAETLSRVRMNAGDVDGARAAFSFPEQEQTYADRYARNLPFYELRWEIVINPAFALRGEIRCASGEHVSGLFDLRRSIESQMIMTGPNHPWLARTRAVAGLCALAQGNRRWAEELANESRQAFAAQPDVSPYFKEPLERLERQLGRKTS